MKNMTTRIAVLAIAGMLLTACGSGGDGGTPDTTADADPAAEKPAQEEAEDTAEESAAGSEPQDVEQPASDGGTVTFTLDGQTWQGDLTECTESFGSITAEGPVESDDGSAYIHVILFEAPGANLQSLTLGLYPDEEQQTDEILFRASSEYDDDGQPQGEGEGSLTTGDKSFEAETLVYDDMTEEVGLGTVTVTCE